MSWTARATSVTVDEMVDALRQNADSQLQNADTEQWDDDIATQQDYVFERTREIADSTDLNGPFNVVVGGHRQRSTTDPSFVSITITGTATV